MTPFTVSPLGDNVATCPVSVGSKALCPVSQRWQKVTENRVFMVKFVTLGCGSTE